jgi:hypothetical protein
MARTLIGQLLLKLQDDASGKAKVAAGQINAALKSIETNQRRLASAPWGVGFQKSLDALKLNTTEIRTVQRSYDDLRSRMASGGLKKAMQKNEISAWRAATIADLAATRAALLSTERQAARTGRMMQTALKPVYVALGGYAGAYMGGLLLRGAAVASGERQREYFRQENAGISERDREIIRQTAIEQSTLLPSVGMTQGMEMFRTARGMFGDVERASQIMPALYKGLVALQSAKGVDVGTGEMIRLLKGIDNLGKNSAGNLGIKDSQSIIEGMVKAAQIEGADLDVGKLFDFARRGKIAAPALSTDFIMTTAPAFMQDMTAEGFGTALSSAYQAMVIGSNAVASKANLKEQERIGIRGKDGLIGAEVFATNPYQWAKQFLVPALEKSGVDLTNDAAVSQAIAKLSRNTNATGFLTRMVQQMDQTDRLIEQYRNAGGFENVFRARREDPFVATAAFGAAFRDLAAAVGESVTPAVLVGMNAVTDFIRGMSNAIVENPALGTAVGVGSLAAAGGATYMVGKAIYGLMTAGTNLNVAALALQRAAVMQGGGGLLGDLAGGGAKKMGWRALLTGLASRWLPIAAGATVVGGTAAFIRETSDSVARQNRLPPAKTYDQGRLQNRDNWHRQFGGMHFEGGWHRAMAGSGPRPANDRGAAIPFSTPRPFQDFRDRPPLIFKTPVEATSPRFDPATRDLNRRATHGVHFEGGRHRVGAGVAPEAGADFSAIKAEADAAGAHVQSALSVTATPIMNTSGIDMAISKARTLLSLLQQVGAASAAAASKVDVTSAYSDYGVAP